MVLVLFNLYSTVVGVCVTHFLFSFLDTGSNTAE